MDTDFEALYGENKPVPPAPPLVYVAAPLPMWNAAREELNFLRSIGWSVSHDWTLDAEQFCKSGESIEHNFVLAESCVNGVAEADLVVAILHSLMPTQGTWVELGVALALKKTIVVMLPESGQLSTIGIDTQHNSAEMQRFAAWRKRAIFLDHPGIARVTASTVDLFKVAEQVRKSKEAR